MSKPVFDTSHFVNGVKRADQTGTARPVVFPGTGEEIATLYDATSEVIEDALASAHAAQPGWAATSPAERGRILRRAAEILRERNQELSELESWDTGKPLQETLVADAASGADCLEYFGGIAAGITGDHIPLGGDFAYTSREALGVCVGIGAWNYPIQIACWKAAPALVCGNTMVFKPSEVTPLTALKLAEIFMEAGLPAGVFNVVQGGGPVGASLGRDDRVAKVSLTGSVPTGRKVAEAAGAALKNVTMELGGKSPMIVFEDADIDNAVGGAINGNFYSSGQICSNGTRVFVHESIREAFLDRLKVRMEGIVIGDPLQMDTNFGPLVSKAQLDRVMSYVAKGEEEGARKVTGGEVLDRPGYYMTPVVFDGVTDEMTIAREEIFGPVMSVLSFTEEDDVIARANDTEFGLAAGIFTRDITRAHRVIGQLQAGTCWINTYNLTPIEMPFGGVKASGMGRENAHAAIEHYSKVKSVYIAMGDVEAPY